ALIRIIIPALFNSTTGAELNVEFISQIAPARPS
ncbi:MAG: hypothetical protein ACI8RT_000614, partial [Candidatus Azotimanducaceae bacterium]